MYILVDTNNTIKYITETAERDNTINNIIWVDRHNVMYSEDPDYPMHIYCIDNMPKNIRVDEYCYESDKGFYENGSYCPPLDTDIIDDLIKSRNNLQAQITELSANVEYMTMMSGIELPNVSTESEEVR